MINLTTAPFGKWRLRCRIKNADNREKYKKGGRIIMMKFFSRKKEEKEVVEETVDKTIEEEVIDVLKTVYDPEIPVDIYSLGLVYNIDVSESNDVHIEMTLTSPACPVAGTLPPEVEDRVKNEVSEVNGARVDVVWEPMWTPEMMTEAAKLELGMF